MKYFFTLILFLTPLCKPALSKEVQKISISDFIRLATQHDPQAESIVSERMRSRFLVEAGLPSSLLLLTVQQEYGISTTGQGQTSIRSIELSKKIIQSGTELSISRSMIDRPDREEEVTELRVEQSLWRNSFGRANRQLEKGLEAKRDALELQVAESYEDYVYDRMSDYIDLQRAMYEKQTTQRQWQQAITLEKNVQERKRQNIASEADVARAKVQTINRREAFLTAQTEYERLSSRLAALTNKLHDDLTLEPMHYDLSDKVSAILVGKETAAPERVLQLIELEETAAQAQLEYEKDGLRPQANLVLGYNLDDSARFSSRVNQEEGVIGLRLSVPFGDSAKKAARDGALLELTQTRLSGRQQRMQLALDLTQAKRQLARSNELIKLAKERVLLTTTIADDEERRYRLGRISLEDVINAKDAQANAQITLLEVQAELNRRVLEWLRLTDQLVVRDAVGILAQ